MYIIIIGLGEVGRHLLKVLDQDGHDVVAVDTNPAATSYAEENFDVMTLNGYGANHDTLVEAGVAKSDLVVAVTNNDEVNLIAALAAKHLGSKRSIARVSGELWRGWGEGVQYGLLGVDVAINPQILVANELARVARSRGATDVIDLADDRIELIQHVLTDNSRMLGKPLMQTSLPENVLVAAIVREGELFVPGGADVLLQNDRVFLVGTPEGVLQAGALLSSKRVARRIFVVGGGVVGETLARELSRYGAEVLIVEVNRERAEELSATLDDKFVTIIHGDGTDAALLEEEQASTYGLFVAVLAEDELNLMASLLAQRTGCVRTAALVHKADYIPIYRQLGIDIALSPRSVASDHILRYSRGQAIRSLTVLEEGAAEVLEIQARGGARIIGTPLKNLDLPRGALLAAIVSDDRTVVPNGDDVVREGESVIMLTTEAARSTIERLFRPRKA